MPWAPVPLCTARSSLSEQTSYFTSVMRLRGPHTTTADSPRACSSDFRIISRAFGRPEKTDIEEWRRGFGLVLEDGVEDILDMRRGEGFSMAFEPQQQGGDMVSGDKVSSTVVVQQHVWSVPHASSFAFDVSELIVVICSTSSFNSPGFFFSFKDGV